MALAGKQRKELLHIGNAFDVKFYPEGRSDVFNLTNNEGERILALFCDKSSKKEVVQEIIEDEIYFKGLEDESLDIDNSRALVDYVVGSAIMITRKNSEYENFLIVLDEIISQGRESSATVYWPVGVEIDQEREFGELKFTDLTSNERQRMKEETHFHIHGRHPTEDTEHIHDKYVGLYDELGFVELDLNTGLSLQSAGSKLINSPMAQELRNQPEVSSSDSMNVLSYLIYNLFKNLTKIYLDKARDKLDYYQDIIDFLEGDIHTAIVTHETVYRPFPILVSYQDIDLKDEFVYHEAIMDEKIGFDDFEPLSDYNFTRLGKVVDKELEKTLGKVLRNEIDDEYARKIRRALEWVRRIDEEDSENNAIIYRTILEILFTEKRTSKSRVRKRFLGLTSEFDDTSEASYELTEESFNKFWQLRNEVVHEGKPVLDSDRIDDIVDLEKNEHNLLRSINSIIVYYLSLIEDREKDRFVPQFDFLMHRFEEKIIRYEKPWERKMDLDDDLSIL